MNRFDSAALRRLMAARGIDGPVGLRDLLVRRANGGAVPCEGIVRRYVSGATEPRAGTAADLAAALAVPLSELVSTAPTRGRGGAP